MSTPPDRPFFHIGLLMLKQFMERDELTLQDRQKCWKIIDSIYHNFSSLVHDQLIRSSFRELDHHRRSLEAIVEMVQDPLDNPQLSDDRILAGFDFAKEVYRYCHFFYKCKVLHEAIDNVDQRGRHSS
ncbi:hypothetical protein SMACR_09053 [Sordaria macrospora]|uniref:Uncharacterized protein n=1 Tax=Sordaria macrospora TaxID=5147 RepID=A0A8S8ZGM0_SORMA|nr:hypothetical protein SMACR_09053 [Sordaria macrospora]WPJ62604.1 hypothetical protein SMAC4_09053 [Sordaria macrospora]